MYTPPSGYDSLFLFDVSTDGKTLLLKERQASSSRYFFTLVDIGSRSVIRRIASSPTQNYARFAAGNSRLFVEDQTSTLTYRLITTTGTAVATRRYTGGTSGWSRSWSGNRVLVRTPTASEMLDLTGTTIALVWSNPDAELRSSWPSLPQFTRNDEALCYTGYENGYKVRLRRASDGVLVTSINITQNAWAGALAASPTADEFVVISNDLGWHAERWAFDLGAKTAQRLPDIAEGTLNLKGISGTSSAPQLRSKEFNVDLARSVVDGSPSTATAMLPDVVYSPDGLYAAKYGYVNDQTAPVGVHVYRQSDGVRVATYAWDAGDNSETSLSWAGSSSLLIGRNDRTRARLLNFTGSQLSLIRELRPANTTYFERILGSSDGSRLILDKGDRIEVFRTLDGSLVGTIRPTAGSYRRGMPFMRGNTLVHQEWIDLGQSQFRNQLTLIDLSNDALPSRTVGYVQDRSAPSASLLASVTHDLDLAVFASTSVLNPGGFAEFWGSDVKVIRVADGAIVRDWKNTGFLASSGSESLHISPDNRYVALQYTRSVSHGFELPTQLRNLTVAPDTVASGASATGTVTLSLPAPAGGTTVTLSADTGVTVPTSLVVPAGQSSATFPVTLPATNTSGPYRIFAGYDGLVRTATVTVNASRLVSVAFNPTSVSGGQSSTGTVTLDGAAGPGGAAVSLVSNKGFVIVPSIVVVPAGQNSATFTATTTDPTITSSATVTGTFQSVSVTASLEVKAVAQVSLTFSAASIKGGNAAELTVSLAQPAPAGGLTFQLAGDALLTPPATVTIPASKTSTSLGVKTRPVLTATSGTVTISDQSGPLKTASTTLQPAAVKSLNPSISQIIGPETVNCVVVLDAPAAEGLVLRPTSSATTVATVQSSIQVPAGAHYVVIPVTILKQATKKTVRITVGGVALTLTVLP